MAVMLGSLYGALKEAGASDEKTKKAAEELTGYDNRFAKLETDIVVVKWMLGVVIAMLVTGFSIVIRSIAH